MAVEKTRATGAADCTRSGDTEKTCPHIRMLHHHVEDHVDQTERSGATAQHRRVPSTCSGALRGYRRNKPFVNQARLTCTRDVGNGKQLRNQLQEQCKSWQDWELRTPWCFVHLRVPHDSGERGEAIPSFDGEEFPQCERRVCF